MWNSEKGYLEQIPLDSEIADVVISNCVINLSPDKRMTYQKFSYPETGWEAGGL